MKSLTIVLALLASLSACGRDSGPTAAAIVQADTVITHKLPGDWTLTLSNGRQDCTAQNVPRTFTEGDFLALCRALVVLDTVRTH